jgi:hypothetical protein
MCRSQWPRVLRRRSTATRLLRSWFRIPPGAWMVVCFVCVACCQVDVSATSWSLVQRSPTDCGASLCVIKKPRERGNHSPRWAAEPERIIMIIIIIIIIIHYVMEVSLPNYFLLRGTPRFQGDPFGIDCSSVSVISTKGSCFLVGFCGFSGKRVI